MSTLLLPDLDELEGLDFEPACSYPGCEHPATVALRCRLCGRSKLSCDAHLQMIRAYLSHPIVAGVSCFECGGKAPSFEEIVEVIPL